MYIIRDYSCGPLKLRAIGCRRQVGMGIIIYKSRRNQIALGKYQDDGHTAVKESLGRGLTITRVNNYKINKPHFDG